MRSALGRSTGPHRFVAGEATALSLDAQSVETRARLVKEQAEAEAVALMSQLEAPAAQAGWQVARAGSIHEAAEYIENLARRMEARSILRTTHEVVDQLNLEQRLGSAGMQVEVMAVGAVVDEAERDQQRQMLRLQALEADIGVTGVDFAIAETGTCVVMSSEGVSRLVSLLPPVHVAIVRRGQVLPGLDELFTLRRQAHLAGDRAGYFNLISGPSRSADIESTIVTGVHGPGEVHMLLLS